SCACISFEYYLIKIVRGMALIELWAEAEVGSRALINNDLFLDDINPLRIKDPVAASQPCL
ncbi:hypothetical protein CEXT_712471, partial [Caerostris extrusa]